MMWLAQIAGSLTMIDYPHWADERDVLSVAFERMRLERETQALGPDGWFTPTDPIPGDAITRRVWPERWYERCHARVASDRDLERWQQLAFESGLLTGEGQ